MVTSDALRRRGFASTARPDAWWIEPLIVVVVFSAFIVYVTWASFQGANYHAGPYLSPLYSPEIFGDSGHSWFGPKPGWWPAWMPFSPAFLILWVPGGFRFTCYYYRGAYYKAFAAHPPSCAVGEAHREYRGETSFPLVLQNLHRYLLFIVLGFLVLLIGDVWKAFWFTNPITGASEFGVGVGSLVMLVNVVLLGNYVLGCHALRHVIGGRRDALSSLGARLQAYRCVTCLNQRHMFWAWMSLFSVALTDVYIRLCAMGIWSDWRVF